MRKLRKINIGLVITIIAIVAIVVYSISIEYSRKGAKDEIRKECEEFIELTNNYCILPEQYRNINQNPKDVDLNSYYVDIKNNIMKHTTSEKTADIQKNILSESIKNQLFNTSYITTEYNRKIDKITGYRFEENQVTITFNSKVKIKQKYNEINEETGDTIERVKENTISNVDEMMCLENKDGKWRVISTQFNYSMTTDGVLSTGIFGL